MVRGSDKTYGELILEAQTKTDRQDIGETLEPLLKRLHNVIEEIVQLQAEKCMSGSFYLPKYYIHIFITKDPLAGQGMGAPNVLRIRKSHVRVTRPSPYQDHDHYLWSVTNLNEVKFEWCIPSKLEIMNIMANPTLYHPDTVTMIRKYCSDRLEKLSDYMVGTKVI